MKAGGTASRACAAVVAEAFAANLLPYPAGPTRVGREPLGRRFPAVPGIPWPGDASRRRPPSRGAGMCPAPSSCVKAGRLCAWRRRGGRPEPAVRGAASARRFPMRPAGRADISHRGAQCRDRQFRRPGRRGRIMQPFSRRPMGIPGGSRPGPTTFLSGIVRLSWPRPRKEDELLESGGCFGRAPLRLSTAGRFRGAAARQPQGGIPEPPGTNPPDLRRDGCTCRQGAVQRMHRNGTKEEIRVRVRSVRAEGLAEETNFRQRVAKPGIPPLWSRGSGSFPGLASMPWRRQRRLHLALEVGCR